MENKIIHKEKQLRVWWSSKVPINNSLEKYYIDTLEEAKLRLSNLAKRDLENINVTDNVGGLEIFYKNEWNEWEDMNGDDIWENMKNE